MKQEDQGLQNVQTVQTNAMWSNTVVDRMNDIVYLYDRVDPNDPNAKDALPGGGCMTYALR